VNVIVFLKKNIKSRIANGHPWVYSNEIEKVSGNPAPGDIVDVRQGNAFIGKGSYNPHSAIMVRILSRKNEPINKSFFAAQIIRALNYRKEFIKEETSFRVIFGEADGLPGLIVDKFADYLVMQINTLGMDKWRNEIVDVLAHIVHPKGIFAKDEDKSARKEQFTPQAGWILGAGPELIPFDINGIHFLSDTRGQKTGFFLDQRTNAACTGCYAGGKTVLDAFSYTGNFGLHTLKGNARFVRFVDYSQRALEVLQETLSLNRIDPGRYDIVNGDTFDYLSHIYKSGEEFDLIIIDPPSLAKARGSKQNALKGYRELNLRAMKILKPGGLLSTSSCTQVIYEEDFRKMLYSAAENTGRQVSILYKGMQPPDHPVFLNIFETEYLQHYLLRITL
jgi:23S rRNA (cytosine1962-C5)-methyltransferase